VGLLMGAEEKKKIKISVRTLVEFILCSGDIDNRIGGRRDTEAMQEGSRIHRKIQKRMGSNYNAEFPLSITVPVSRDDVEFDILIDGRADGILSQPEEKPAIVVDEIKCVYMELSRLEAPVPVHRAQAMCYAYIYGKNYENDEIGIRLTYCNIETENMKYFEEDFSFSQLEEWFLHVMEEYGKWAAWQYRWSLYRNESIKALDFPFDYRPG
jgi:DNA excision repair protein ERCC-2